MARMMEAHVDADTHVTIHDVTVPTITHPHHVLIKVVVSGCNPKDWKMPAGILKTIQNCPNSGDDVAGIVHAVGDGVTEFRPGDRVAALHQLGAPHGSYAEYCLVYDWTTFLLSPNTSFEEAATVPMASLMAAIGLFGMLKVRSGVWDYRDEETPLLIYGAASAVGGYAIKLAQVVGIHPLICVAGRGIPFVTSLIEKDKGDMVIDYRDGNEGLVQNIRRALNGRKLEYAFDAVSENRSYLDICQVLDHNSGRISLVLPQFLHDIPPGIEQSNTMAGSLWTALRPTDAKRDLGKLGLAVGGRDFGYVYSRTIARLLQEGRLTPHPYEVIPGGLAGIEKGLKNLRAGTASGVKYVYRISETPSLR